MTYKCSQYEPGFAADFEDVPLPLPPALVLDALFEEAVEKIFVAVRVGGREPTLTPGVTADTLELSAGAAGRAGVADRFVALAALVLLVFVLLLVAVAVAATVPLATAAGEKVCSVSRALCAF